MFPYYPLTSTKKGPSMQAVVQSKKKSAIKIHLIAEIFFYFAEQACMERTKIGGLWNLLFLFFLNVVMLFMKILFYFTAILAQYEL